MGQGQASFEFDARGARNLVELNEWAVKEWMIIVGVSSSRNVFCKLPGQLVGPVQVIYNSDSSDH